MVTIFPWFSIQKIQKDVYSKVSQLWLQVPSLRAVCILSYTDKNIRYCQWNIILPSAASSALNSNLVVRLKIAMQAADQWWQNHLSESRGRRSLWLIRWSTQGFTRNSHILWEFYWLHFSFCPLELHLELVITDLKKENSIFNKKKNSLNVGSNFR